MNEERERGTRNAGWADSPDRDPAVAPSAEGSEVSDPQTALNDAEEPCLLSCFDALGWLLRRGFFVVLVAGLMPAWAAAHGVPARVWIDGHDVDGPPPGPEHVPIYLGVSLWPTGVASKIRAERTGEAAADTRLKSITGINASVFGHHGFYSAEFDVFQMEEATADPFTLAGATFTPGAKLSQLDVAARAWREIYRFDALWGTHYHLDFGFRYTLANSSFVGGTLERTRDSGFLCPELVLQGVRPLDNRSALHTRTSFASNGATTGRETSVEFAVSMNTHLFQTAESVHDLSIGVRGLTTRLGFTDTSTGQETTISNTYLGPELSYACRW